MQFLVRSAWLSEENLPAVLDCGGGRSIPCDREHAKAEYMVCRNRNCRHFERPLAIPTVPLAPADPRLVAAVDEDLRQYAAIERQWQQKLAYCHGCRREHPMGQHLPDYLTDPASWSLTKGQQ